jgi:hypothetical protein
MSVSQSYRHLLKAAQRAFAADAPTLLAARERIRSEFRSNERTAAEGIAAAEEAAEFLSQHIVQIEEKESGDVALRPRPGLAYGDLMTVNEVREVAASGVDLSNACPRCGRLDKEEGC